MPPTVRALLVVATCWIAACGPPLHGAWQGIDAATRTQTDLVFNADGTYTLVFAPAAGSAQPHIVLDGEFSAIVPSVLPSVLPSAGKDGEASAGQPVELQLRHSRLTVRAPGEDVIVSEDVHDGALCAPSAAQDVCVRSVHRFSAALSGDRLQLSEPPFQFMAHALERKP